MLVRIATVEDIEQISRLFDEFFKYNHSQQPSFCAAAKESGQYPKSVVEGTTGVIFVAETDDTEHTVIGFIHVEEDKTPAYPSVVPHRFATIVDFYVTPQYRKRGAGKALLEKAKEWAISRGLAYLELFVLEENEIGKSFYRREKFVTASHTMRYVL
ncbi:MAG: GNAT family N-acetyltransferase [Oscillospiraceae bacterium]|nr:GNAT family N-acetyltransferase [Oscillospiraceae bacterium]